MNYCQVLLARRLQEKVKNGADDLGGSFKLNWHKIRFVAGKYFRNVMRNLKSSQISACKNVQICPFKCYMTHTFSLKFIYSMQITETFI